MTASTMRIQISGEIFFWKGPSPYYFVKVPAKQSAEIKSVSALVTYGWGVIPVHGQIGRTPFKTSLFPKNGLYLVPLKVAVRKAEKLEEGQNVKIVLEIG